jgi:predicted nucleic acid-binding protein
MQAAKRLDALAVAWTEVDGFAAVRAVHPLRAADALQLAAALVLSRDRSRFPLVTGDRQLAGVAELEGFDVIVPEG